MLLRRYRGLERRLGSVSAGHPGRTVPALRARRSVSFQSHVRTPLARDTSCRLESVASSLGARRAGKHSKRIAADSVPPGWEAHSTTLEELTLAYLREPGAAALPGPARVRNAESSEVTS